MALGRIQKVNVARAERPQKWYFVVAGIPSSPGVRPVRRSSRGSPRCYRNNGGRYARVEVRRLLYESRGSP